MTLMLSHSHNKQSHFADIILFKKKASMRRNRLGKTNSNFDISEKKFRNFRLGLYSENF